MKLKDITISVLSASFLAGCGAADRIANVGRPPVLSAIDNPVARAGYRPVQMPMPAATVIRYNSNSLWQTNSHRLQNNQRASQVGDILTINVQITDSASINNNSSRTRSGTEDLSATGAVSNVLLSGLIPEGSSLNAITDVSSGSNHAGTGSVDRSETLTTTVSAIVTQVLPNGNLVIEGRQEMRVNFEVRELIVAGVVRPQDINPSNMIESSKIAEARISYGGRGQITDVQQPRYGQQLLDVLLPF